MSQADDFTVYLCGFLKGQMAKRGITRKQVADNTGIAERTLYRKLQEGMLWVHEFLGICRVIGIPAAAVIEIATTEYDREKLRKTM